MKTTLIVVNDGEVTVVAPEGATPFLVINMGEADNYIYKNNLICQITAVNEDGSLNLKCVDSLDGSMNNRILMSVSPEDIEFYSHSDELDDWDFDDEMEDDE